VTVVDLPRRAVAGYFLGGRGADGLGWSPIRLK
jgi:hypothetical protein